MEKVSLERVRDLNYDHHRRMDEWSMQLRQEGKLDALAEEDDRSYRTLLQTVPKDRMRVL